MQANSMTAGMLGAAVLLLIAGDGVAPVVEAQDGKAIPAPPDVAAPPADAEKTKSGLAPKVLSKGTGTERPTVKDAVNVHYTGWTTEGEMLDSSVRIGAHRND